MSSRQPWNALKVFLTPDVSHTLFAPQNFSHRLSNTPVYWLSLCSGPWCVCVCTEYIFGKVWDHLFYWRKEAFDWSEWLESPIPTMHLGKPYAFRSRQWRTCTVEVWILPELLSSSGFYKESCRSAAATSLTSNTYTSRAQLKETDTTVWLRVVLLVYPTWHMWSQVSRPTIPLKWLVQTAGCGSKGIYSSRCHPSLIWWIKCDAAGFHRYYETAQCYTGCLWEVLNIKGKVWVLWSGVPFHSWCVTYRRWWPAHPVCAETVWELKKT